MGTLIGIHFFYLYVKVLLKYFFVLIFNILLHHQTITNTNIMKTISTEQMSILIEALRKGDITQEKFIEIVTLLNESLI
jgi:uncharacterized membrane protein